MYMSVNDTVGYRLAAIDGKAGKLSDLLFDDTTSRVRYLVIDVGGWFDDKKILLAPAALGTLQPAERTLPTALTKGQVKDSPPFDTSRLSRQMEEELHQHHGWTPYWAAQPPLAGAAVWGTLPLAAAGLGAVPVAEVPLAGQAEMATGDPSLRSAREVIGFYVSAEDDDIGHVEDLLVEEEDWTVRFLVIDTRNWLPGRKVLVASDWLDSVDWTNRKIAVALDRAQIKSSPEYDPTQTIDGAYQERLYLHYARNPFWMPS